MQANKGCNIDLPPVRKNENENIYKLIGEVLEEYMSASATYEKWHSAHEGYGVITEEFKELEEWIFMKQKDRNLKEMKKEAIQLAAVAIRFAHDICNEESGRK